MIRASSRRIDGPGREVDDFVRGMFRLGQQAWTQMFSPAMAMNQPLWDAYLRLLRAPATAKPCRTDARCEVPETECPPRCVCELRWEASPRDEIRGTIRVTNTGKDARAFTFPATSLVSDGHGSGVTPTVSPASATLEPGESVLLTVHFTVTEAFEVGRIYTGEVEIRGRYEQCVHLHLDVQPESRAHCDVEQGEIPVRVRAHHWYGHFQCEEPCFEPIRPQRPTEPGRPVG